MIILQNCGIWFVARLEKDQPIPIKDEAERSNTNLENLHLQGSWAEETQPDGLSQGEFDATLKEALHLITQFGYAKTYLKIFSEYPETMIAKAMDKARSGHFQLVPTHDPAKAWYTNDDRAYNYSYQITETRTGKLHHCLVIRTSQVETRTSVTSGDSPPPLLNWGSMTKTSTSY